MTCHCLLRSDKNKISTYGLVAVAPLAGSPHAGCSHGTTTQTNNHMTLAVAAHNILAILLGSCFILELRILIVRPGAGLKSVRGIQVAYPGRCELARSAQLYALASALQFAAAAALQLSIRVAALAPTVGEAWD